MGIWIGQGALGASPSSEYGLYLDSQQGALYSISQVGAQPLPCSSADGLTAHAGGGQANATPINTQIARFTTVATLADSAVLPKAVAGLEIFVYNSGAQSMNVFPAVGDTINALAANTALAVAAAGGTYFVCSVAGKWFSK